MTLVIRPMQESDIGLVLKGYHYINRDIPMRTDAMLDATRLHEDILGNTPKAYIDVATFEEETMGFIFYSTVYFASTGQVLWVTNLYVDPLAPRQGISSVGKKLVDAAMERHPNAQGVYAVTERNNHGAQLFFKRLGATFFENFLFVGSKKEISSGS